MSELFPQHAHAFGQRDLGVRFLWSVPHAEKRSFLARKLLGTMK